MNTIGLNLSTVVKKSPVVIVKNFIYLQMAAIAVFFLSGILFDYGELLGYVPLLNSLSFHIAEALGIFTLETILVFYIFFRWYKEYYDIKPDKIIHGRGIIFRQKTVIPFKIAHSISFSQGPLGRLTKYGTIELRDSAGNRIAALDHLPEPQKYAELIVDFRDALNEVEAIHRIFNLQELISKGEHEKLEFKSSFRWDLNQEKVNKNLEKAAMKTIVAFLNSNGGQLVLGVDDSGKALGLDYDYQSLPKSNFDGFQNHFTNVFHQMIGPEFRQYVILSMHKISDKECCQISIMPSKRPAYLKSDRDEEFYIRTGNGTTALRLREASSYIDSHWRGNLL